MNNPVRRTSEAKHIAQRDYKELDLTEEIYVPVHAIPDPSSSIAGTHCGLISIVCQQLTPVTAAMVKEAMVKEAPDLDESVCLLCRRVETLIGDKKPADPGGRVLIALAGVPGSGKSTISSALLRALPNKGIDEVAVLPMVSQAVDM